MYLFNEDIGSWEDWGRVFQSIAVFEPLVGAIMKEEKLAFDRIYNLCRIILGASSSYLLQ